MVGPRDPRADRRVEAGQVQRRLARHGTLCDPPGQRRQEFGAERPEEALHLAAPLGAADGGVDDPHPQVGRGLPQVDRGEVGAMVDMQHVRHAADRPGGIGLAPDRLPER